MKTLTQEERTYLNGKIKKLTELKEELKKELTELETKEEKLSEKYLDDNGYPVCDEYDELEKKIINIQNEIAELF